MGMKYLKKILLLLLLLLMIGGCAKEPEEEVKEGSYDSIKLRDTIEKFNNNETFAVFLHQTACPYCREAEPVFRDFVISHGYQAYELNFTEAYKNEAEYYSADKDILFKIIDEVLRWDDEWQEYTLFVPEFVFVKDGKIVYEHCGTVDTHDPYEAPMTEAEIKELEGYFAEGFRLMYEE